MKVAVATAKAVVGWYCLDMGDIRFKDRRDNATVRIGTYQDTKRDMLVDNSDIVATPDDSWIPIYEGDSITLQF